MITSIFPRSENQLNRVNESDSEILKFNGKKLLVNVDEFSKEDRFLENDPYRLGWNIAVGALSDIYATGGVPKYFAQSLVIGENWDEKYIERFSCGVRDLLGVTETFLIGGDLGKDKDYRYTAVVIGECDGDPLLRSNAKNGDSIFITGEVGGGNLEAFLSTVGDNSLTNLISSKFTPRKKEGELIKKFSKCCIDTSDGVFNSLNIIAAESSVGYQVENIPYITAGKNITKVMRMNPMVLFLGEAGEYELLFTIPQNVKEQFVTEAKECGCSFYEIGKITEENRVYIEKKRGKEIDLSKVNFRARDFNNVREYIKKINEI